MDLFPENRIVLFHGYYAGLELARGVFEVLVEYRLVIEVEGYRPVNLGQIVEKRKLFQYLLWRFALIEGIDDRVERNSVVASNLIASVTLSNVLSVHWLLPSSITPRGYFRKS